MEKINKENTYSVNEILVAVCEAYGIDLNELHVITKKRHIVEARQLCFYLIRKYTNYTLIEIANLIRKYTHSNVYHGIKSIKNLIDTNKIFREKAECIVSSMNNARLPHIYIAGKVTGLERSEVVKNFAEAQALLEKAGFCVMNPTTLIDVNTNWEDAMRIGIIHLMTCSYIFLLPDWRDSKGATIEYKIAKLMGIKLITNLQLCKKLS